MRIREMNERLEVSKSQVIVEVRGGSGRDCVRGGSGRGRVRGGSGRGCVRGGSGRDYKRTAMDSRLKANNLYLAVAELIT